ncbi:MAG: four helix bundle protein [Akkermansia sp.]|nr:four helix bundle protein [Akkermansia sp.]
MKMNNGLDFREKLTQRTRTFALRVFKLCTSLPNTPEAFHIRDQLFRCASSVAANYRASGRAKSDKDYLNKLKICEEESDEAEFWMDMLAACELVKRHKIEALMKEANELTSIITASCITKRRNMENSGGR